MVVEPKVFGRVYLAAPEHEEDLLFVNNATMRSRSTVARLQGRKAAREGQGRSNDERSERPE
jgi:hypothetical protein